MRTIPRGIEHPPPTDADSRRLCAAFPPCSDCANCVPHVRAPWSPPLPHLPLSSPPILLSPPLPLPFGSVRPRYRPPQKHELWEGPEHWCKSPPPTPATRNPLSLPLPRRPIPHRIAPRKPSRCSFEHRVKDGSLQSCTTFASALCVCGVRRRRAAAATTVPSDDPSMTR